MSTSVYLVSSDIISNQDALGFIIDIGSIDIDSQKISGQFLNGRACVWINFLGGSVLDESDEDEIDAWKKALGADACSFFELTVGKSPGSMDLMAKIAEKAMERWNLVLDDSFETIYTERNYKEILKQ
ncbi:hypothetical protein [Microbulbifer sp. JTAC008]|uniref:hypothetical protein n=1 Tax=unclassified Microbulbifer TaxID=2619833 RepID=UPI0040391A71